MQLLVLEVYGPGLFWKIQPLASYDYHWSGRDYEFPITSISTSLSFGLARAFSLGYAETVVYAGAAYSDDTYQLDVDHLFRSDIEATSWGVLAGFDLRFKFFDRVDALIGYRLITREQAMSTIDVLGFYTAEVTGRGADHCISAGISVVAWGA